MIRGFGRRPAGKAGSGEECSIGRVNRRLAILTGGVAVGLAALWRIIGRRPLIERGDAPSDPRAADLRQRLDEARAVAGDRDEFEAAETPVDEVEAVPQPDPEERRRAVHAEGRSAVDRMRGDDPSGD